MLAMRLSDWSDVRAARDCAGALARAAGVRDPQRVELAVGELGNNCLEHRDGPGAVVLRMGCRRGTLVIQAVNPCRRRPTWQTSKPVAVEEFREGGYGLLLVRSVAREVRTSWHQGRAGVRAEFASGRHPGKGRSPRLAARSSQRGGEGTVCIRLRAAGHVLHAPGPAVRCVAPAACCAAPVPPRAASREPRAGA
jgi:anti-sigma regulatory factor (Ser/Thr protein kinase)